MQKDQARVGALPTVQSSTGPRRRFNKDELIEAVRGEESEHPPQYTAEEQQALRMLLDPRSDFDKFVEGIPPVGTVKPTGLLRQPGNMRQQGELEENEKNRERLR